jgi:PIN domain nuclease of toxin-antitoxin system
VRLLLDTHVFLWSALEPHRIAAEPRAAIEARDNDVFVSVVSALEIAIKQSLGKLDLAKPAERWVPEVVRRSGLEVLPLDLASALGLRGLPWHHRDPFDRLLVAQALQAGLTVVTHDPAFGRYGVSVLWT